MESEKSKHRDEFYERERSDTDRRSDRRHHGSMEKSRKELEKYDESRKRKRHEDQIDHHKDNEGDMKNKRNKLGKHEESGRKYAHEINRYTNTEELGEKLKEA